MRALVSGGRGFIGSFLVQKLLEVGHQVTCLLRPGPAGWLQGMKIERVDGDVTDPDSLAAAATGAELVFHLAGATKTRYPRQFFEINAEGTRNLLQAVLAGGSEVRRFVLVSSLAAAGPSQDGQPLTEASEAAPVSEYGKSKLLAEQYALECAGKLPVSIIRPPVVFGPRDRDVFNYFKYARRGVLPVLAGGSRTFSAVYVKDLVQGIILAAERPQAIGNTYFICNDEIYSWSDFAGELATVLQVKTRWLPLPLFLAFVSALGGEVVARVGNRLTVMNLDKFREIKMKHWVCSNSKAKTELEFQPEFTLQQALRETAEWYFQQGWL